jgi:prepilin-type N-terminal cleavage/methylation domain-containing protein/prepilin-type processing-associated H-X9-DG protein
MKQTHIMTVNSNRVAVRKQGSGAFTLIELLVVVAVISVLLAILFPVLSRVRKLANIIPCQSNLRQIAVAYQAYLNDHDGAFYQGFNANVLYGGWAGEDPNSPRPLNKYLSLPEIPQSEKQARVFRCPSDKGANGVPFYFYNKIGTSYQTNILLIGQDQIGGLPGATDLAIEINKRLPNLNLSRVDNHSLLALIGDFGWSNDWLPRVPREPRDGNWHGRLFWHNIAFLDGHVDFVHIRKGHYLTDEYTVLPFKELYALAREVQ